MNIEDIINPVIGTSVAIIVGIVLIFAIGLLIQKGWPVVKALVRFSDALGELPEFMEETRSQLTELRHEVFPNSGKSFRDVADRTEKATREIKTELADMKQKLANDNQRIIALQKEKTNV